MQKNATYIVFVHKIINEYISNKAYTKVKPNKNVVQSMRAMSNTTPFSWLRRPLGVTTLLALLTPSVLARETAATTRDISGLRSIVRQLRRRAGGLLCASCKEFFPMRPRRVGKAALSIKLPQAILLDVTTNKSKVSVGQFGRSVTRFLR